jgi:diguanylate cyclase (GGDEF)-like protein
MRSVRAASARPSGQGGDADAVVRAEQLRLLNLTPLDALAQLLAAAVVVACLWRLFPIWTSCLWFCALAALLLVRREIQRRYRGAPVDPEAARGWGVAMTAGALATGCLWGLVASVFVLTDGVLYQVLAFAALSGMTIAGVVKNAAAGRVMFAFIGPILSITVAMLLVRPDLAHVCIAVMIVPLALVLASAGRSLNQSILADVRLRLELAKTGTTLANTQAVAGVGSWEVEVSTGRIIWSDEMARILGLEASSAAPSLGLILARVHPEDRERVEVAMSAWLSGEADLAIDHRVGAIEGPHRWIHQVGLTQLDADGRPLRRMAIVQDVTDKKRTEEEIQFANVVMKTQMEASEDGFLVVDKTRRIISFNKRFAEVHRCPISLLETGNYAEALRHIVSTAKDPAASAARIEFFYDNPGLDGRDEFETRDGRFLDRYTVSLTGPEGAYLGRAWFYRDVTEQKRALARALETSRVDQLTGLSNRGAFVDGLRAAIARAEGDRRAFAVLYIDLDRFKDVNDTLGHPAGDQLLRTVADRLLSSTRPGDIVARFGGDEFAIIVADDADGEGASRLAADLIRLISEPYLVSGVPVRISASVGIAHSSTGAADAETLLSRADMALYKAKAEGRSEFRSFTTALEREVRTRVTLGQELHEAIAEGQLFLLYQPQIHLGSGRIVGVEALVRWRHPIRGVLAPELFVPPAEQTGLIGKLGGWVLSTACRQAKTWLDGGAPPIRVAVNVSALQFRNPLAFEADIEGALADNSLPSDRLELELTETVLMNALRDQGELLERLRARGVTIALDDFGTGYASLDYLRRFPIDRIKIAQDFVRDLEAGGADAAIVKATIGLARDLGIEVIAEGVERLRQLELLRQWGCDELQGFYFAEPLCADQIPALLSSQVPLTLA